MENCEERISRHLHVQKKVDSLLHSLFNDFIHLNDNIYIYIYIEISLNDYIYKHYTLQDGDQDEITEINIDAALELLSEACSLESCTSDNISETKNILDIYTDAVRLFK